MAIARLKRNNPETDTFFSPKAQTTNTSTNVIQHNLNAPPPNWGYSQELIEKAGGVHTNDLSAYGIRCVPGISGWVVKSDASDAYLARFDSPYQGHKCMQSEGKNQPWYKLLQGNPDNPHLNIVEGFKDGLALFSLGQNVLITGGIDQAFAGYSKLRSAFVDLLEEFDPEDITILFDNDEKLTTKAKVDDREIALVKALEGMGWSDIQTLPSWQKESNLKSCKDVNDIYQIDQGETLQALLDNPINFNDRLMRIVTDNYYAQYTTEKKWVDVDLISRLTEKHQILNIKSPMGSGKTYGLIQLLKQAQELGLTFVIISPLIALGRQITQDLKSAGIKVKYRDNLKRGDENYPAACCLESVKSDSKLNFNKRTPAIVIIDELPQVLTTLLNGSTLKNKRDEVAFTLRKIITKSKYTLCLGADITQLHVNILAELTGVAVDQIGCYHNVFNRTNFPVHIVSNLKAIAPKIIEHIKKGEQVFVSVDAQKTSSKNAGVNLAEQVGCPPEKLLIIDSKTVEIKDSDAREIVINKKLELLNKYLLVICSPSVNAGFSIPPEIYSPELVVCIHTGCANVKSFIQSTCRVRDYSVPRVLVFTGFIKYSKLPANGALTPGAVKKYFAEQEKVNQKFTNCAKLKRHASDSGLLDWKNLSLALPYTNSNLSTYIYESIALENIITIHRKKYVQDTLKTQGALIASKEETKDFLKVEEQPILEPLKDIRDRNVAREAQEITQAKDITKKEAEAIREMEAITKEQQLSLKKQSQQDYNFRYKDIDTEDVIDGSQGLTEGNRHFYQATKGIGYILEREEMRQRKLAGKSNFNPGLMLQDTEKENDVITLTQQDFLQGHQVGLIGLIEKMGLIKAIDYCKKGGLEYFYIRGNEGDAETPEPIENLLGRAKILEPKLRLFTHLDKSLFEGGFKNDIKLLKELFALVGHRFDGKKRVRFKDPKTGKATRQTTICTKVTPTRTKTKFNKYVDAQYVHETEIINKYRQAKKLAELGKQILIKTPAELLEETDNKDTLIKAAKFLPTELGGMYKFFELVKRKLHYSTPKPAEITLVTPENNTEVIKTLNSWIRDKVNVGLDTETYESVTHKQLCYKKKSGKWYWLNPWTDKEQEIKPGLDQNSNNVRIISISDGKQTFVIDLDVADGAAVPIKLKPLWESLEKLLKTNKIIGHNLKFDTSSLRKYGLVIKDPYDTLNTTKLLFGDCGAGRVLPGGYGLANVAKTFLGIERNKTLQKSNWGADNLDTDQIIYAGQDAADPLHIHDIAEEILVDPAKWGLPEFASEQGQHANRTLIGLENRTIYHVTEMQYRGVPFDVKQAEINLKAYEAERQRLLGIWEQFEMGCEPQQVISVAKELNRRYEDFKKHPLAPEELDFDTPKLSEDVSGTGKDVVDEHPHIPELQLLKAYREKVTVINQISKALLSAQIHDGVCKTEYGVLSGSGRLNCGGRSSLGAPNLQALIKSVEFNHFGYLKDKNGLVQYWSSGLGTGELTEENTRTPFRLNDAHRAFITEDANASHARLAVGFGQDQFGRAVMEDENIDNHSSFAIRALKIMLKWNPECLDNFPNVRAFVTNLPEGNIDNPKVTKAFKNLKDGKDNKTKSGKKFRSAAKTLFYSVLNGAQNDKMRKVMVSAVGMPLAAQVGQEMFNTYWSMYQGIWKFIEKQIEAAKANTIQFGTREFNITTLPDGTKLAFAQERGGVAITKLIACQWSRCEATAIKRILDSVESMPQEWGVELINTVHDEVSITCKREHWVEANKALSDEFTKQYQVYLKGFVPSDEPWEAKLDTKLLSKANKKLTFTLDKDSMKLRNLEDKQKVVYFYVPDKRWLAPDTWTDK